MMPKRSLQELLAVDDPAWPLVQSWIREATNPVEVLPPDDRHRGQALEDTQVTIRSPMGALIYETGGVLIDHGWLRLLGSGHPRLPRSMPVWNRERSSKGFWLIGDDVVGGFFALDGGALGPGKGHVYYFAPDSLRWEPMQEMGYTDFLMWTLKGNLASFYESLRWPGWATEASSVGGDRALSIWPPPWVKEGKDIGRCSREPVPISEVYGLNVIEFPRQLSDGS
jgi:hypothetical protein